MDKVKIESHLTKSLFICSICQQILYLPTVINECFHRFCKLCIINHFRNKNTCPICDINITNPLEMLKSDITFQRMLYKIFPTYFQNKITCKPSQHIITESIHIQIETKINVYLKYWDLSLDLSTKLRSDFYLECTAQTTLLSIEKFIRIKYQLPSTFQIDLFYEKCLLDIENERLIDIFQSFPTTNNNRTIEIHFLISRYGYYAILKHIRQTKRKAVESTINSNELNLKVKLCRTQSSTNNWYIARTDGSSIEYNGTLQQSLERKPTRRRIRFIPTMVQAPPTIFDYLSIERCKASGQKTICKVLPSIRDNSSFKNVTLIDHMPLDLSFKT